MPKGKEKMDENFGQVEVYFQEAVIRLPVERNSSGPLPLVLSVTSQGCADAGVCYPPQTQSLRVELPDPFPVPRQFHRRRWQAMNRADCPVAAKGRSLAGAGKFFWLRPTAFVDALCFPDDSDSFRGDCRFRT